MEQSLKKLEQQDALAAAKEGERSARQLERLSEHLAAMNARDWDRFTAAYQPGFRSSDRRRMVQLELDRDRLLEFTRQLGDMRSARLETEVLATRGERLALLRFPGRRRLS
jgi:hypothetical protein